MSSGNEGREEVTRREIKGREVMKEIGRAERKETRNGRENDEEK